MSDAIWNRDRYARKIAAKLSQDFCARLEESELDYIRAEVPCLGCGAGVSDLCVTLTGSNRKHLHSVHVDRLLTFKNRYTGDLYRLEMLPHRLSHAICLIRQLRRRVRAASKNPALNARGGKVRGDEIELRDAADELGAPEELIGKSIEQGTLECRRASGMIFLLREQIQELGDRRSDEARSGSES